LRFYGCDIHAFPEGSDSPSRLALAARRLGYSGIVISNHSGYELLFLPEAVQRVKGIDVAWGTEVVSKDQRALIGKTSALRRSYEVVAVHGGFEAINRAACENPNVDILLHPEAGRSSLTIAMARSAKLNQVAIGFDLSPMIRLRGGPRTRWLELVARNLAMARKFRLPMVISADVRSHLDLRSPRDLMALAELAGMEDKEALAALRYPGEVVSLNRRRWAASGVEVL